MKINTRSIRFRLCLWYVVFTLFCILGLSSFSYTYLDWALSSTSEKTLLKRVDRLVRFMNEGAPSYGNVDFAHSARLYTIAGPDENFLQIDSLDGRVLYPTSGKAISLPWPQGSCQKPCFNLTINNGHRLRMVTVVATMRGTPVLVRIAGIVDEHNQVLDIVFKSYLVFLPLLLIVTIAGGYGLSSRALYPVARLTRAVREIGVRELNLRLPVPDTHDELQDLAETCNQLLSRVQVAVERLKQFTSDISHDLRTSISVMFSSADLCLRRSRSESDYRQTIETMRTECDAISSLLSDLLEATRADMGDQGPALAPIDLSSILVEVFANSISAAEIKSHIFVQQVEPDIFIWGDASTIRRLANILIDNAIKYTPSGGRIVVGLHATANGIVLQVADNGIGISPNDSEHIFERFYRVESSRNRDQGGNGLGLAIAKWIANIHSAEIFIDSSLEKGSVFTVRFHSGMPSGLQRV
jgi:two-component system heavy metal sensor histidine kinase CusS